jgi:hypothetical protein
MNSFFKSTRSGGVSTTAESFKSMAKEALGYSAQGTDNGASELMSNND